MTKMDITIKKTTAITNETEWFLVAPPKKGIIQWKDGYSAKEFAKFATLNGNLQKLLQSILEEISFITDDSFIGEPEYETKLPGQGEGRNHDLLLYNKDLVIGIEAKVNEDFDETIKKKCKDATDNKINRIKELKKIVFRNPDSPDVDELRYQLLTATAGTLLEAFEKDKELCVFLVLSFHKFDEEANSKNKAAFKTFVEIVCGESKKSQIFTVKGKKITCWFIERDISFIPETFKICQAY